MAVRLAGAMVCAATVLAAAACGGHCQAFSLSLASDRGGQASPVAAAAWFAGHGGVGGLPRSGWREDGRDAAGTVVRSGGASVHAVQGSDGTWQVSDGRSC